MTSNSLITQETIKILDQVGSEVKTIISRASEIKVANDDDYSYATSFCGDLKGEIKRIKALQIQELGPTKELIKKLDNGFKMRIEPLENSEGIIKNKMANYARAKQAEAEAASELARAEAAAEAEEANRKADEALAKAEAAKTEKGKANALAKAEAFKEQAEEAAKPVAFEAPAASVRTDNALASTKKVWKFEIIDRSAITQEYLVVDEKKITQAIRDGLREIPGVRIFQDIQISIR